MKSSTPFVQNIRPCTHLDVISIMRGAQETRDIPLIVCTAGEFDEKNIEELNNEMQDYLLSIMKKGTFGRKELINRVNYPLNLKI